MFFAWYNNPTKLNGVFCQSVELFYLAELCFYLNRIVMGFVLCMAYTV